MNTKVNRLRELDFLRGLAIILVLFRHIFLSEYLVNMGWIGVDLFFVLSGFLVSGLLFKEYLKHGDIKPTRFLIRRGFKIYPIYYLFYGFYLVRIIFKGWFDFVPFLSDLLFIQNYVNGFGFAFEASWTLAVEEHFYIAFSFFLWMALEKNWIVLKVEEDRKSISPFEKIIFSIMAICLMLRIASNMVFPEEGIRNFTMTHLRIDSLLAGVLVGYLFYFRIEYFKSIFRNRGFLFFTLAILLLSFTPFVKPMDSVFVRTYGFSACYIAFAFILCLFLTIENINDILNKYISKLLVDAIAKFGLYSYAIYISHSFVIITLLRYKTPNVYLNFAVAFGCCVLVGMLIFLVVEKYFLMLRDKYFPNFR